MVWYRHVFAESSACSKEPCDSSPALFWLLRVHMFRIESPSREEYVSHCSQYDVHDASRPTHDVCISTRKLDNLLIYKSNFCRPGAVLRCAPSHPSCLLFSRGYRWIPTSDLFSPRLASVKGWARWGVQVAWPHQSVRCPLTSSTRGSKNQTNNDSVFIRSVRKDHAF